MNPRLRSLAQRLPGLDALAASLFWSWNLVFLTFIFAGFLPQMLPELLPVIRSQELPPSFPIFALVLCLIPLLALLVAWLQLRAEPRGLLALGWGLEAPLMMLVGMRLFGMRQLTPATALILGLGFFGLACFGWQLLDRRPHGTDAAGSGDPMGTSADALAHRPGALLVLLHVGLSGLLLLGLFSALWLGFYLPPMLAGLVDLAGQFVSSWRGILRELWQAILDLSWQDFRNVDWLLLPFSLLGPVVVAYTTPLLLALPVVVVGLYARAGWRNLLALAERSSRRFALGLGLGSMVMIAGLYAIALVQPQHRAFALLEREPSTTEEARALLERSEAIRAGLLNSYLGSRRYFSVRGGVRHVAEFYAHGPLHWTEERAEGMREAYERLASPLLYQPVEPGAAGDSAFSQDRERAAERYAAFFDAPIAIAEREALVRAVQATWNIDQARTDRLAIDDREIHLESQSVTLEEHGDLAEIELHEVYRNQTFTRQEVIYWFSLPESAVMTGLWLGNSDDREAREAFRVAPRGAAQQLYREELRRQVDPALLEQIGPRQYRLRVFPIEPKSWRWDGDGRKDVMEPAPALHLWMRYAVMAQVDAAGQASWALPRLARLANVYWDDSTQLDLAGETRQRQEGGEWLGALSLPASAAPAPRAHRAELPGGITVVARPASAEERAPRPEPLRLAVVLDRSRSMQPLASEAGRALASARYRVGPGGRIDLYLAASAYSGQAPARVEAEDFDAASTLYFGGQNPAQLLEQYAALRGEERYDAVLILSDGSGYELGASDGAIPDLASPIWMVHLGGAIPIGYDDASLEAIQASGGGVVGDIDAALVRIIHGRREAADPERRAAARRDLVDGYVWWAGPTADLEGPVDRMLGPESSEDRSIDSEPLEDRSNGTDGDARAESAFARLAARYAILAGSRELREASAAAGSAAAEQATGAGDPRQEGDDAGADRLALLDGLHAMATEAGVVTPYSSMIVLLNQRQHERLDRLEQGADRFDRELEGIGETEAAELAVTGVPEPEEWLLLLLAAGLLWWRSRRPRECLPQMRPT